MAEMGFNRKLLGIKVLWVVKVLGIDVVIV